MAQHYEVHASLRALQRHGSTRDATIVQLLRHTGIRVGELVALRLGDVTMSERKGKIVVCWGEGARYREIDLNLDARRALGEYLAVRPAVPGDPGPGASAGEVGGHGIVSPGQRR